jgi:1-acyl-sn-glycerol-3-phosphate acyltransferase
MLLAALFVVVDSFSFPPNTAQNKLSQSLQLASIAPPQDDSIDELSHVLSSEQIKALVKLGSNPETQKIINGFGMWALVVSLITGPIWMAAMGIVESILDSNPNLDPHRGSFDKTGKVWAHAWLRMTNSYPTFSGETSLLRKETGPCLYVANHASWLDIPVLCTVLDPVFKFIAKGELQKVPCVGHQLTGGHHILIDREDRRSQLRTFKQACAWLEKGVPLMAFPEGMRSKSGRLQEFKGGIFSIAKRTGVPIIPISLSHTHAVMPSNALFPVQSGKNKLRVHVHPAIDTSDKTEAELEELVRESLLSALPRDQHPLEQDVNIISSAVVDAEQELMTTAA